MSIYVPPRPELVHAKAMLGVGAAAMMTQPMAPWVGSYNHPHKIMRAAAGFWKSDPWVRSAEKAISGKFSTVPWHLEDEDDVEIDDEYTDQRYQQVRLLIEQPQAALDREDRQVNASTRRELWAITSRHMGVCGSAFWYLDRLETVARTPLAILYIAPWRMTPSFTKGGNLIGWVLDWNEDTQTGTPLQLDEIIQFNLEPPDEGAFPPGLIESAMSLIKLDALAIGHAASVLTSGGRLAGIVSAKDAQAALPDDKFQQLVRDFRTINELPDAAKRTNIIQGPIDFNRTSATPEELQLIDLMAAMRDHILAVEGVPYSQLGGSVGSGLNSGERTAYDEASFWQNGIEPRLVPFQETVQFQLLDRYKLLGIAPELIIEYKTFDDDTPKYDLLVKAAGAPLRNWERREIIGKEPFGPEILGPSGGPLDDEIWLPSGVSQAAVASEGFTPPPSVRVVPPPQLMPGEETPPPNTPMMAKSPLTSSLTALRRRMEREHTADLKRSLVQFLDDQRHDIASRLRSNPEHIAQKPKDTEVWFSKRWDRELIKLLERPLVAMAQNVNVAINRTIPVKAAPAGVIDRALKRGAARVTKINERTRDSVQSFLIDGLREGLTANELADRIESGVTLDNGQPAFDEYRAELIARTELADAYNSSAIASYEDAGVTEVEAIDGDDDEECRDRVANNPYTIEQAMQIEDHPNGTLDWVPVIDYDALREALEPVKAAPMSEVQPIVVNIENKIPVPMKTTILRDEFGRPSGTTEEYANG